MGQENRYKFLKNVMTNEMLCVENFKKNGWWQENY